MKIKRLLSILVPVFFVIICKPVLATGVTYTETQIPHEFLGSGTAIGLQADDNYYEYNLPFTFDFYGIGYTSIFISTNGYICFNTSGNCTSYNPRVYMNDGSPRILIAGKDLITGNSPGEDVYVSEEINKVTIRWRAVEYGTYTPINFELVLYKNGDFQMNYGTNIGTYINTLNIGIGQGDGIVYTYSVLNGTDNALGEINNGPSLYWSRSSGKTKTYHKDTRCSWSKPVEPTWIRLEKQKVGNVNGMNLTWTQLGADKMDILIDDGTGKYPWKITDISNDGHEFLPNVTEWQNIKLFASNHCRDGSYSVPVSYSKYPYGWYNIK